jgi:hypothetical protein
VWDENQILGVVFRALTLSASKQDGVALLGRQVCKWHSKRNPLLPWGEMTLSMEAEGRIRDFTFILQGPHSCLSCLWLWLGLQLCLINIQYLVYGKHSIRPLAPTVLFNAPNKSVWWVLIFPLCKSNLRSPSSIHLQIPWAILYGGHQGIYKVLSIWIEHISQWIYLLIYSDSISATALIYVYSAFV